MPIAALFDINLDGEDHGYEAENSESLSLKLRDPSLASTVLFQVYNPGGADPALGIAANPPRASGGAPTLTLVGATSGQAVSPTTVDGAVTCAMPASGSHSWIFRCVVNGGQRQLASGVVVADPSYVYERGVFIRTVFGSRRIIVTERTQFGLEGWAEAFNALADAGTELPDDLVGLIDNEEIEWAAKQTFSGSLVLGTVQLQAVPGSTLAVTLGANVTRLYLFDGDAEILSISGASEGRMLLVHVTSGTKQFGSSFFRPGNVDFYAGPNTSFWMHGRGSSWAIAETVPLYTPPGTARGALQRTVTSRLNDEVHVTDFMTPAQIADAQDGTMLYDMQPAIQAAVDWLLFYSLNAGHVRGRLRVPAGILRIDRTIHLNYGTAYRTLIFEGEGILRGAEHAQTGTAIVATFGDAPAIAVTTAMDMVISKMSIVGINQEHIASLASGPVLMSHLDPQTWVDPSLPASASSRYAPYAAIAIDPYTGAQPVVHYPDVPFPAGMEATPQYGKSPSTEITVEDVRIDGFVVGVVLQPADYDGSGDFVRLNRVQMWWCTYGLSWGNSQARSMSVTNCTFAWVHTAFLTSEHGKRIGMPQFAVISCSFMTGIQLFVLNALGYGLGPTFINCFSEAIYKLGYCNGQSADACGLTFRNCEWGFTWWDRYGVPTWVLEGMGAHQIIFDTTVWYNTAFINGWLGFRCTGSNFLTEPARQLQFIGSESMLPEAGSSLAERCATNATQGIVVSKGSTCMDRYSVICGYTFNLDTELEEAGPQLITEQHTAERKYAGGPVYAKKLKSLATGNDPGIDVAWRVRTLTITTVVSTVGRTVTITMAGATAALLAHLGGDVGDVVIYGASGDGAAFNVRSRTGTTLVLYAMTGFDMDNQLLTPVVAGANLLWPINCRRFVPSLVIYADMTSGSPTLTNVISGSGAAVDLTEHFHTGDFIYVDDEVDRFIEPTTDATLVSMDNTAKTLTFGGNFLFTRTRWRLGVFVRAAMPNA